MATSPQTLHFKPGIQRDGTRLTAPGNWIDGLWTRFNNGRPRKMGGFRQLTSAATGIQRSFQGTTVGGTSYIHMGSDIGLRQMAVSRIGDGSSPAIRTPDTYTMMGDELWQLGTMYDPVALNAAALIAHPGRNLTNISSDVETSLYSGTATGNEVLTELDGLPQVSGGFAIIHPYITYFGSAGFFGWTGPNKTNETGSSVGGGEARPTSQKIVAGMPIRGGNGPSGVYWSLNALIRTSFIGGSSTWAFDTVSEDTSIMSSRSMATLGDSIFYWMGVDCFYVYNGTLSRLPNTYNSNWAFDNVNPNYREKCFAFANKRWGEIWFCFPFGDATECTHAAILNTQSGEWYDTKLPGLGRGGALAATSYPNPILSGVEENHGGYSIWEHEIGVDEVRGAQIVPIRSYIESADVTMLSGDQPQDATLSCVAIEPDILQVGEMSLTITGNANARSAAIDDEPIVFSPGPAADADQILHPKTERRQMRFRWESNTLGGSYEIGAVIAHLGKGSGRQTG